MLRNGWEYSLEPNKHLSSQNIKWDQMESPKSTFSPKVIFRKNVKIPKLAKILRHRLSEKIKKAKLCSAGGLIPALNRIFWLKFPLSSILEAKIWKKVKISWNICIFELKQFRAFQKVKYFFKNCFWSSENGPSWSELSNIEDLWDFLQFLTPRWAEIGIFVISQTIGDTKCGQKGNSQQSFKTTIDLKAR